MKFGTDSYVPFWMIFFHKQLYQSAKPFPPKRKKQLLSCLPRRLTVNKKETKWSKVIHSFFFCFHIRPALLTFDSQPLDLSFVQPSGASLPSIGNGIPSRCSHLRGFSIVFPGQRKKNHQSHPTYPMNNAACLCMVFIKTLSFPFANQISHVSPGTMRRLPENFKHASDKDITTVGGEYEIFPPPPFPPFDL